MALSVYLTSKLKWAKFRPLKSDENELKTNKIAAMSFCFVFLCLFCRFKTCERDVQLNNGQTHCATVILKTSPL